MHRSNFGLAGVMLYVLRVRGLDDLEVRSPLRAVFSADLSCLFFHHADVTPSTISDTTIQIVGLSYGT